MASDLEQASECFKQGDLEGALQKFQSALAALPQVHHAPIQTNVGVVLMGMGQLEAAISAFEEAIRLNPSQKEALLNRAICHQNTKQYAEAIAGYDAVLELDPGSYQAHTGKAEAWANQGQYELALTSANAACQLDSKQKTGHVDRGFALLKLGRYAEANAALQRARMDCGDDSFQTKSLLVLGLAREALEKDSLGDSRGALNLFEQANELDDTCVNNLYNLGVMLINLKRHAEALVPLMKVMKIDPNNQPALGCLGTAYAKMNMLNEAIKQLERACALAPGDMDTKFALGVVRLRMGNLLIARTIWQEVLEVQPNNVFAAEALRLVDICLQQHGEAAQLQMAKKVTKQIQNLAPHVSPRIVHKDPKLVLNRNGRMIGMQQGDEDQIYETLEKVFSMAPQPPQTRPTARNEGAPAESSELPAESSVELDENVDNPENRARMLYSGLESEQPGINQFIKKSRESADAAVKIAHRAAGLNESSTSRCDEASAALALEAAQAAARTVNFAQVCAANADDEVEDNTRDAILLAFTSARCATAAAEACIAAVRADPAVADTAHAAAISAEDGALKAIGAIDEAMENAPHDLRTQKFGSQAKIEAELALDNAREAMERIHMSKLAIPYVEEVTRETKQAESEAAKFLQEYNNDENKEPNDEEINERSAETIGAAAKAALVAQNAAAHALDTSEVSPEQTMLAALAAVECATVAALASKAATDIDPTNAEFAHSAAGSAASAVSLATSAAEKSTEIQPSLKRDSTRLFEATRRASKAAFLAMKSVEEAKSSPKFMSRQRSEDYQQQPLPMAKSKPIREKAISFGINMLNKVKQSLGDDSGSTKEKHSQQEQHSVVETFSSENPEFVQRAMRRSYDSFTHLDLTTEKLRSESSGQVFEKAAIEYDDPGPGKEFSYEQLCTPNCPEGVDPARKEEYLSESGFKQVFNMSRDEYKKLPPWRRVREKQSKKLF